jgi:hypothetical protein
MAVLRGIFSAPSARSAVDSPSCVSKVAKARDLSPSRIQPAERFAEPPDFFTIERPVPGPLRGERALVMRLRFARDVGWDG